MVSSSSIVAQDLLIPELTDGATKKFLDDSEFYTKYDPKEVLGRGLCSVVRKCVEKNTNQVYAVKIIDLTRTDNLEAEQTLSAGHNEIRLLRQCNGHPNIIHLHEAFQTQAFLFLIFELCPNGELFDFLNAKVRLSEKRTRPIMKQLLEALSFLHSHKIAHRDVKTENILLDVSMNVKLSDFGFAAVIDPNVHYKELLGTPGYLSPEMLKLEYQLSREGYGLPVDMWACGVVLYTLIAGRPPFWNRKLHKMTRDVMAGNYSFPSPEWDEVTENCKDLISRMLVVDQWKRITAFEALKHPFFTSAAEVKNEQTLAKRVKAVVMCIRFINRMKKMVASPRPLSPDTLLSNPYSHKQLRRFIDASAFNVYGHWIKRTDEQNRGALFEHNVKPPTSTKSSRRRYRLLSGADHEPL